MPTTRSGRAIALVVILAWAGLNVFAVACMYELTELAPLPGRTAD